MTGSPQQTEEGLSPSEREFLEERGAPQRPRIERRRPPWVVAALVWATFGIYIIFWVGIHWAEMKRELRDDRMYPLWHALSMIVPIYSYFRFHANFRVLNELLATTRATYRVRPLLAVATFLLASLLLSVPVDDIVLMTLNVIAALAAISWILYHGQTGMNAYWDAKVERRTTNHIELWERLVIGVGAALWFIMIVGLIASGGQV